jgi:hypothetical protein
MRCVYVIRAARVTVPAGDLDRKACEFPALT